MRSDDRPLFSEVAADCFFCKEGLDEPLPRVDAVKEACDKGRSVWSLPRRKPTIDFLSGVDTLAHLAWHRTGRDQQWPPMPPPGSTPLYVPGWSRDAK